MDTASTISSSTLGAAPRSRPVLQVAAIGALAATVANVALWIGGRAADVDFLVSPPVGDLDIQVGVVLMVLTTLLTFAAGSAVLAPAARHSRRWVRVVMAAAAVVAVVSAGGPLSAAHDTATGALLAAMHLVTGAAFVATAATVREQ
ncbi:MAG: DUF6069 family protein [Micromonosporaceae bacterium]